VKTISIDAFETYIQPSHPNAHIERRDGVEVVVIPTWNFDTDEAGEIVYRLDRTRGQEGPKFKAGDVLRHTETGAEFEIVDPLAKMLKLRKGPKADG